MRDVCKGEACPTDSGFIADQDRATIAKSSTLPHDTAPRVTSPAAIEGGMQQTINELTALCTSLQRKHSELLVQFQAQTVEINKLNARVNVLEDNQVVIGTRSADDAPIKGRKINEEEGITGRVSTDTEEIRMDEREVAVERTSGDTEEMATVLTSMDAATVLAGGIDVPTPLAVIPFPLLVPLLLTFTLAVMIHAEEELQGIIDSLDRTNETIAKYVQEYQDFASELPLERRIELISDLVKYQDNYSKIYKFQSQQRRPWTKKQKKDYYMTVIKNNLGWKVKDFKGMTFEEIEAKFAAQEKAKKQKTSEEVPDKEKSPKEIPEEKVKEMMQLVPIEEVYVQALQVKHPIIDWKVHIEGQRSYWKIISIRPASNEKEIELWVELKRLYEPDPEDQLWAQTQNYMHAPIEWKLYDLSGVHHVTAKDKEIFMLVEKDYPLRIDLLKHLDREDLNQLWRFVKETLSNRPPISDKEMELWVELSSYKLQVENYSQMVNDLILKIYKIANSLRQQVKKDATARRNFPLPEEVLPLPEVCTAIIVKEKPSVKDDSFL
nr:hypothetical protein [Tanacetum cinerariifolium]